MGRAAIIHNGIVTNVILAGPDFVSGGEATVIHIGGQVVSVGDLYANGQFIPAPDLPQAVPETVTPLQMRKALRHVGLKPSVDAYIASLGDSEAVEEWEYALAIERGNPVLANAAVLLGMTEAQVDDLFRLAATLT